MKNDLSIDVVIPVFNGAAFIEEALISVVQQTFLPHQIFVINDGSTDNTSEIVEKFAKTSTVPIIQIQKKNGGPSSARNAGIRMSTSQYIAFLDADDVWQADKLSSQISIFEASSDETLGIVYGRYSLMNEQGVEIHETFYNPKVCLKGLIFSSLLGSNKICGSGSAVLIKRTCFDCVGYFDETLRAAEDWDMWLRLAERYMFDYVDHVVVRIRRHGASMQKNQKTFFLNQLAFYRKWTYMLSDQSQAGDEWAIFLVDQLLLSIRFFNFDTIFVTAIYSIPKDTKKKIFWKSHGFILLYICRRVLYIISCKIKK
ncbi:hypothetical protein A3E97_05410 [Candidatus Uhrbacteria bacterium RIFCSPHIGHO2_12_FULL_47_12]|uniref:Glycosyltransferase 2-like domain-containing protein n=1 Tax=Candidatus Uhrbacteria bacterium RIFCSPLOWO2_02_FULL_48_18 TaxID=1802408 RepID=A0A1F7VAQ6_9BACT|nr:MAG: hypothetical protein A3E97_05410 [Candidatus Uhrbacteria bacterium RIFCSPHIGHO2_12_FULL_47_12]OGL81871.1 MAG: hypothetical protein A3B20_02155 [Candidatus Uhrbacteria bacterium RIFCSPLOWO2_01_FULL_47_17]OGL87034.1 MAG: hypothetical protein A3I41_03745 [Candidatus Uhrbacteria bacterium RIFCSPLOWO2_02_FULL_48_18]OGL92752.1 MAG: hypothetical protein A3H12_03750 [Candidatus Uhrbacteria bacterium RIFCSPLOWO2_12_FULL_47_9]